MTSNVTAGNILVVILEHGGGNDCHTASNLFTDTRGSVFTQRVAVVDTNGAQAQSCIVTAPLTGSGAETVTKAQTSNLPASFFVYEVSQAGGVLSFITSSGTADSANTVTTGNMVVSNANNILFCGPATNTSTNAWTSATPVGATTVFTVGSGYASAALYKIVAAGTYTCSFTKTSGDARNAIAGLVLSYSLPASSPSSSSFVM